MPARSPTPACAQSCPDTDPRSGWQAVRHDDVDRPLPRPARRRHLRDAQSSRPRFGPTAGDTGIQGSRLDQCRVRRDIGPARHDGSRDELLAHVAALAAATDLPLNVDSERCFADDLAGVTETVELLARRALPGARSRIGTRDTVDRPRRGIAPSASPLPLPVPRSSGLVLTARCENHLHGVTDLDDTIARLQAYVGAGAEVVYAPGLVDIDQITTLVAAVGVPVNVLILPGGPSVARARRSRRAACVDRQPADVDLVRSVGCRSRAPSRRRRRRHERAVPVAEPVEGRATRLRRIRSGGSGSGAAAGAHGCVVDDRGAVSGTGCWIGDPVVHAEREIVAVACEAEIRPAHAGRLLGFHESNRDVAERRTSSPSACGRR